MVNQKSISFKITFENLEALDDAIRNSSRWTNRNAELNRAVNMYVDYMNAREDLECHGDSEPMRKFVNHYFSQNERNMFT